MMRTKLYVIEGVPTAWKRARLSRAYKLFDGQIDEKILYGLKLSKIHQHDPLFEKPMNVDLTFCFKNVTQQGKPKGKHHTSYPDIDNLAKFILDAMKNVIIKDDRMICSVTAKKEYAPEPLTRIIITELE